MAFIGKIENKTELRLATQRVLTELENTIVNNLEIKTSTLLLYWLNTWGQKILPYEKKFDYSNLKYYKRGNAVQADFGFKVGSEQGGLHYAIVIENENPKANKTVMVAPLRSLRTDEKLEDIKNSRSEVFLGYGIFKEEIEKLKKSIPEKEKKLLELDPKDKENMRKQIIRGKNKLDDLENGSVAILNQICALSKMRIGTPRHEGNSLFNFILIDEKLDEIDEKISRLYMKPIILETKSDIISKKIAFKEVEVIEVIEEVEIISHMFE